MVLFIKGTRAEPKCKFTRRLMGLLEGYSFKTFNILENERIRQWTKFYSEWPTFPQVFINSKFVGGIDVVSELIEEGEFDEMIPEECKKVSSASKIDDYLNSVSVLALIQGPASVPETEESKNLVSLLSEKRVKYMSLNLSNCEQVSPAINP